MPSTKKIDELIPPVVVRMPVALRDRLRAHAEAHDLAVSQVVRKAVREHLDAQEGTT